MSGKDTREVRKRRAPRIGCATRVVAVDACGVDDRVAVGARCGEVVDAVSIGLRSLE